MSVRAAVLPLLAVVLLLPLTGCGGTTTATTARVADEQALVRVIGAHERLVEAGTVSFTATMRGTSDGMPMRMTMRGRETTTGVPVGRAVARTTIGGQTVPMDMVIRGSDVFMRLPEDLRLGDTPWMRQRMTEDEMLTSDPAAGSRLIGQADEARRIGRERVDGRLTTRYRISIDVRRAAEHGPADVRPYARALLREDPRARQDQDVWIDDTGVLRRTTCTMFDEEDGGLVRIDMRFVRTGVSVSAWAPPADQVSDAPSDDDPA